MFFSLCIISTVLGKNPPGKKNPDPKPKPIPNLILTLPLTPHGGSFSWHLFQQIIDFCLY